MFDAAPATVFDAALRGMLLALLALLAAVLARDRPRLPAARAGMAICLGLCVQVVGSTPMLEARLPLAWQAPLVAVAVGNAVLFWVFVQALFDDDFVVRPVHVSAWGVVALLSAFNCIVGPLHAVAPVTFGLQRAVPLLFAVLAAVAAAAQWRADLVEGRRRLRAFIVVTGVAYTLVMLVARLASPRGRLSETMATIDVAMLLFMMAVVAARMLSLGTSELFPSEAMLQPAGGPSPGAPRDATLQAVEPAEAGLRTPLETQAAAAPDPAEERLAASLHRLMQEERAYRTEDLTVAGLAARLAVPEYRLRRLINQRLGHRNFNAYVNGLRLDEARGALADPGKRDLPVLTIALDAGFQSIGPFNRAFKAAAGVTPTEFRRAADKKLADC